MSGAEVTYGSVKKKMQVGFPLDELPEDPVDLTIQEEVGNLLSETEGTDEIRRRGPAQVAIEDELHTDEIVQEAVRRYERSQSAPDIGAPSEPQGMSSVVAMTGASLAEERGDWMYGFNRPTGKFRYPTKTGLNFSLNALSGGTAVDAKALPEWMREVRAQSSIEVKKKRIAAMRRKRK